MVTFLCKTFLKVFLDSQSSQKPIILKQMTSLLAHFDGKVLVPDSPVKLPVNKPLKVTISILDAAPSEDDDIAEGVWLRNASKSSSFDFLKDEPELYRLTDGKPFDAR